MSRQLDTYLLGNASEARIRFPQKPADAGTDGRPILT